MRTFIDWTRSLLCSLGFHQPNGLVFKDVMTGAQTYCKRGCGGVYHDDFGEDSWLRA